MLIVPSAFPPVFLLFALFCYFFFPFTNVQIRIDANLLTPTVVYFCSAAVFFIWGKMGLQDSPLFSSRLQALV